jgi:hypothetical protein
MVGCNITLLLGLFVFALFEIIDTSMSNLFLRKIGTSFSI